jgi:hypothetical protein
VYLPSQLVTQVFSAIPSRADTLNYLQRPYQKYKLKGNKTILMIRLSTSGGLKTIFALLLNVALEPKNQFSF